MRTLDIASTKPTSMLVENVTIETEFFPSDAPLPDLDTRVATNSACAFAVSFVVGRNCMNGSVWESVLPSTKSPRLMSEYTLRTDGPISQP
jgi:hypothetical protein